MGAYYNPEVAKDYTPEITAAWSKAANNVTGGIIKGIEAKTSEYEALSEKYIKNRTSVEQTKLALLKDLGKSTSGYLGNDWQDTFKGAIDSYADLSLKIANNVGSPEEKAQYQKELASIEASIDLTKEGVTTLASYSQNTDKQVATAGQQGGYAVEGDLNLTNALLCGNGKIGGTKNIIVERDPNTGTWGSKFSFQGDLAGGEKWGDPEDSSKPLFLDATKISQMSKNGNQLLPIIPVIDNNIQSLANSSNLFAKETKTVDGKPVSTVKGPDVTKYYEEAIETPTNSTDTATEYSYARKFKNEDFKKDLIESNEFKSQISGLLSDPQGFISTLNNTFKQTVPGTKKIWTLNDLKDPKMAEEAKKLYTDAFANYITTSQKSIIYDEDVDGKRKLNIVKKDAVTAKLSELERSFEAGNSNEKTAIGDKGKIMTVAIGNQEVKVIVKKDKNGKVIAEKYTK
jgi:hypothetical protein